MTIRNLVKTSDYHMFLIDQNTIWNKILVEVQKDVPKVIQDASLLRLFSNPKPEPTEQEKQAKLEYEHRIEFVKQRLIIIENEWNRSETYIYYKFDMIETHDALASSFFEYVINSLKKFITYH